MNRPDPNRPDPTRPGPTRPSRFLTAYFLKVLIDTNLELLHSIDTGLEVVVSTFHCDIFITPEVIAFFAKAVFGHFYIHFCV